MVELRRTERFARWLDALGDVRGRARIQARIERLAAGNPGDVAPVGGGVSELRIDFGPGYRVYFIRRGRAVIILLAGGQQTHTDRRHQSRAAVGARLVGVADEEENCDRPVRCGRASQDP